MFDKVYYSCSEVEQKEFMKAFIEKIELDELDLTTAESKATYAEIKDYVDVMNEL